MCAKSVLLISRLPLHGVVLSKLLSRYYDVVWIGKTFPFKFNPLTIPYILSLEFWKLISSFRKMRFSLIIIQYISLDGLLALMLKRIFGVKVVLFAVGSDVLKINEHAVAYPLIRKVIMNSDTVLCSSTLIEKKLQEICGDSSKIKALPPIIDIDDFEYYAGPKEYDVITIGSLDENKNQMLLLNACKLLPSSVKVLIIGKGTMRGVLEKERKETNLNVSFAGEISHKQVFKELQKSRIYVHTSKSEGGPLAALEAMFSGLPVVLVESPYVYVLKHSYGFLVHVIKEDSAQDLANKIAEVSQNYEDEWPNAVSNKQIILRLIAEARVEIKKILDYIMQKID
jgi:glycosyltransferase involved in cell wall biosynthesis